MTKDTQYRKDYQSICVHDFELKTMIGDMTYETCRTCKLNVSRKLKVITKEAHGGTQRIFSFPNSPYQASVVCHKYSYGGDIGLFELAVLKNGKVCYTSGITRDVIGHLTEEEVQKLIKRIADLK